MPHIKTTRIHRVHPVEASSAVPAPGLPSEISEGELAEIRAAVLRETTADLRHYRPDLVRGSISRRMVLGHSPSAAEYAFQLRTNPEEARALWLALQGNPGGFFRDADTWEALRNGVLGSLSKDRQHDEVFRAWVPCCRTGEEVYSAAMTLLEVLEQLERGGSIQVFGTDVDALSLKTARAALYPETLLAEVPHERRSRFFSRESAGYRVNREVRDACLFARHNVAIDPPLSRMDLILFRNQLPLLTESAQSRLLERLHYSLKPGAVLALGAPEFPEAAAPWFTPAPGVQGIYLRRARESRSWFAAARTTQISEGNGTVPRLVENRARAPYAAAGRPSAERPPAQEIPRVPILGKEMNATQHFQALLEEQAKAIEALRTANEEIVIANEEMQVTTEELVATREELQATNEELATVNEEMRERNSQLSRTSAELTALIGNLDAAVLTVDGDLRIRRFTPRAARLFSIAETDTGRRITDLRPKLQLPELETLLKEAAGTLAVFEREVADAEGKRYRVTIRPYRDEDQYIDGAILTAWPAGTAG